MSITYVHMVEKNATSDHVSFKNFINLIITKTLEKLKIQAVYLKQKKIASSSRLGRSLNPFKFTPFKQRLMLKEKL